MSGPRWVTFLFSTLVLLSATRIGFAGDLGDVDNNGRIEQADADAILHHLTGETPLTGIELNAADINLDGKVDIADFIELTIILQSLTTVTGIVHNGNGSAAAGVPVALVQSGRIVKTAADGSFSFNNAILKCSSQVRVCAIIVSGVDFKFGHATVPPVIGGVTDVGVITLALLDRTDADADGVPDQIEPALGFDPTKKDTNGNSVNDGQEDSDNDGLPDWVEYILNTDPANMDSDCDGIKDGTEDADRDLLSDLQEVIRGTNPFEADTDGDGFLDGEEVERSNDPLDPTNHPNLSTITFGAVMGGGVSILNKISPTNAGQLVAAMSPGVSILNKVAPSFAGQASAAMSPGIAVLNNLVPSNSGQVTASMSPGVSVLNNVNPVKPAGAAQSPILSIKNGP